MVKAVLRLGAGFKMVELGLVGDVAQGARLGAAAKQGALRAFQHFDALEVGGVDIDVASGELHRHVVEVEGDVRERRDGGAGLVAREAGRKAAHVDIALARAVVGEGHIGRVLQEAVQIGDVELFQLLVAERLNGLRNVLDRLVPARRGDDDLLDRGRAIG